MEEGKETRLALETDTGELALALPAGSVEITPAGGSESDRGGEATVRLAQSADSGGVDLTRAVDEATLVESTPVVSVDLDGGRLTGEARVSRPVPSSWDDSVVPVWVWESPAGKWQWLPTEVSVDGGEDGAGRVATARTQHFSSGFLGGFDATPVTDWLSGRLANLVGRAGAPQPTCPGEAAARAAFDLESDRGDAVKWCVGTDRGRPVLQITNNRSVHALVNGPVGTDVVAGRQYALDVETLVDVVGEGIERVALDGAGGTSRDGGEFFLLGPGKTLTFSIMADSPSVFGVQASVAGTYLTIIGLGVSVFSMVAKAAGLTVTAKADTLWNLLGDGKAGKTKWAGVGAKCVSEMTKAYPLAMRENPRGQDPSVKEQIDAEVAKAMQFAVGCGSEMAAASIEDSGPFAWLIGSTAAAVSAVVSVAWGLVMAGSGSGREVTDGISDLISGGKQRTNGWYAIAAAPRTPPTQVVELNPFSADGDLAPGWRVDESVSSIDYPLLCGEYTLPAVSGVSAGTYSCGGTADNAHSCWAPSTWPGQLVCLMGNPEEKLLHARTYDWLESTEPADDPIPSYIETEDGSLWFVRVGGAWSAAPQGWVAAYGCDSGPCASESQSSAIVVRDDGDGDVVDTSRPAWTVHVGTLGDPGADLGEPRQQAVSRAWFVSAD